MGEMTLEKAQALLDAGKHLTGSIVQDFARAYIAQAAEITRMRAKVDGLAGLLARAEEELRLIRMKDTGAVYDVGLRIDISAALTAYKEAGNE